jgi:phytanoyl-CoA hydroxylase
MPMNDQLTGEQIDSYRQNGFLVIENFLSPDELEDWRTNVMEAVRQRAGQKMPGKAGKTGEDDGINHDTEYYGKVFDQLINLWQTHEGVRRLMTDPRIGELAARLAGVDGIRIWHDQALFKRPWANPTAWHLDTPFWSFSDRKALSIWVALDDATLHNGCLYFIPGSYKSTRFENSGITKNMDGIFSVYPELATAPSIAVPMKAGSCSFHNGLTIHGAGANMTGGHRRAMTCAYMPDGNVYNGQPNVLPDPYVQTLSIGDRLNNELQNPIIYRK